MGWYLTRNTSLPLLFIAMQLLLYQQREREEDRRKKKYCGVLRSILFTTEWNIREKEKKNSYRCCKVKESPHYLPFPHGWFNKMKCTQYTSKKKFVTFFLLSSVLCELFYIYARPLIFPTITCLCSLR